MRSVKEAINFKEISRQTGVTKGSVFYSATFKSWVVEGHPHINLICVHPPLDVGDIVNGEAIHKVTIKNDHWVYHLNQCNE